MRIERWDLCEIPLTTSETYENPFRNVELAATFNHRDNGQSITVNGFYDGGSIWRIRFMPTELGVWDYVTRSSDPGMDEGIR